MEFVLFWIFMYWFAKGTLKGIWHNGDDYIRDR
jgi:hypothetical protein